MSEPPHSLNERMLINGVFCDGASGERIDVVNPATGDVVGTVPRAIGEDVQFAVDAAASARVSWAQTPPRERGHALYKISEDIEAALEEIARLLASETGNAIRTQSRPEVRSAIDLFRYYAGLGGEIKGQTLPINRDMLSWTWKEPLGIVAAVIPWNAPIALAVAKIAPAMLTGNVVVLKPAEDAPLAVLRLAEICNRFLPKGVLNVITGYGSEAGAALASHRNIDKITFTGSTEVGKLILRDSSSRIVPVSLELGGKSPSIVFPDADTDWAADGVVTATRVTRQSQACVAGSRVFVHESIFKSFTKKLASRLSAFKVGDPLDEETDIGSVINVKQFRRINGFIRETQAIPGVQVLAGGLPENHDDITSGFFMQPTLFTDIPLDARVAREEVFGPVICAIPWKTEEEVVRMANDTEYGLAGFLWAGNPLNALRLSREIEAGWLQINQAFAQFPGQPFGGFKQSGIGREFSLEGMIESYTRTKNVTMSMQVT